MYILWSIVKYSDVNSHSVVLGHQPSISFIIHCGYPNVLYAIRCNYIYLTVFWTPLAKLPSSSHLPYLLSQWFIINHYLRNTHFLRKDCTLIILREKSKGWVFEEGVRKSQALWNRTIKIKIWKRKGKERKEILSHRRDNMQYWSFCVWLISFNRMIFISSKVICR